MLLTCAIGFSSCNKFLDTPPKNFTAGGDYFSTADQLNSALTGVYQTLASNNLYGDNLWSILNVGTDESFYARNNIATPATYNYTSSNTTISAFWTDTYNGINRANLVLDNINKPLMDSAARSVIRGEALFLRAYYYFLLVSNWGDVPMPLHASTSPDSISFPKTNSKAIYAQIINDMTTADSLVKPINYWGFPGRISQTAVEGILARVCLFRAGSPFTDSSKYWFGQSLNWSNKVINSGIHSLNPSYSQIFINQCQNLYDIKESIWEVEFYGNGIGDAYTSYGWVGSANGIACSDFTIGYSYGFVNTTAKLFNAYAGSTQLTSPDTRRDWCIAPFTYKSYTDSVTGNIDSTKKVPWTITQLYNRNSGKWRREYELSTTKAKNSTPINFPLLRYADVLLMKAEAENEVNNGPAADAYTAINQVRRRGYGLPVNTPSATADLAAGMSYLQFQQAVYNERMLELNGEGLRRNDLIRWGIFIPTMKALANQVITTAPSNFQYVAVAGTNIQQKHLLFPIPISEITLNPAIGGQNPGW